MKFGVEMKPTRTFRRTHWFQNRIQLSAARAEESVMRLSKTLYEKDLYPELADIQQSTFAQDCLEHAEDQLARGHIDRRAFVRLLALMAAAPVAGKINSAHAAAKELVLVNWGG